MRDVQRRLEKLEQQINEVLGPAPPSAAEQAAAAAEWNTLVETWSQKLLASMDIERDSHLISHWALHLNRKPCVPPCPVPAGLLRHLDILWGWRGDESKPIALPPEVVEVYLTNDRLSTRPHLDCESCGYPCPISFFFIPDKQINHFPRCPLCHGFVGYHAWDIKHGSPGYGGLVPYSQR